VSDERDGGRRGPIVALAAVVALILVGLWLVSRLHDMASIQDCVASGRTNCAPITAPPR